MTWLEKSEGKIFCLCVRVYRVILYAAVIVAEVTQPSLGVGYEIGRAVDLKKRILCLFRPETGKRKHTKGMFRYAFTLPPSHPVKVCRR